MTIFAMCMRTYMIVNSNNEDANITLVFQILSWVWLWRRLRCTQEWASSIEHPCTDIEIVHSLFLYITGTHNQCQWCDKNPMIFFPFPFHLIINKMFQNTWKKLKWGKVRRKEQERLAVSLLLHFSFNVDVIV